MDDETNKLLRQLIDLQKEQLELTRKNLLPLWTRIRFSLLGLLILMTLIAVGVGVTASAIRLQNSAPTTPSLVLTSPPIPQQTRMRTRISPADAAAEDLFGEPMSDR
jgi:hypothetical protein